MNNELFINVRKAYRLLYDYQKSVLGLVNYIANKFGFDYEGGYPQFSNSSSGNGRGRLSDLSWDWLNMYYYKFPLVSH